MLAKNRNIFTKNPLDLKIKNIFLKNLIFSHFEYLFYGLKRETITKKRSNGIKHDLMYVQESFVVRIGTLAC